MPDPPQFDAYTDTTGDEDPTLQYTVPDPPAE